MKKLAILLSLLFAAQVFAQNTGPKLSIIIKGGAAYIPKNGSESDYIPTINSFPVTPAHWELKAGGAIQIRLFGRFNLELGVDYTKGSNVTLVDPGDGDELQYNTLDFLDVAVSVVSDFSSSWFDPYVLLGAGLNNITGANANEYKTKKGYAIYMEKISPRTSMGLVVGLGVKLYFSKHFGILLDNRFVYLIKNKEYYLAFSVGFII